MKNSNRQITEQILRLMQRDNSVDAPQNSVDWAKNLFRARAAEARPTIMEKIMAVLSVDLSPQRAAFGERSAGTGAARQMLFDAGDNSIDLRIKKVKGGFEIRGQVLGEGFAGGSAELTSEAGSSTAAMSETSEFTLSGIKSGSYTFTARGSEKELVVEGLEIS